MEGDVCVLCWTSWVMEKCIFSLKPFGKWNVMLLELKTAVRKNWCHIWHNSVLGKMALEFRKALSFRMGSGILKRPWGSMWVIQPWVWFALVGKRWYSGRYKDGGRVSLSACRTASFLPFLASCPFFLLAFVLWLFSFSLYPFPFILSLHSSVLQD